MNGHTNPFHIVGFAFIDVRAYLSSVLYLSILERKFLGRISASPPSPSAVKFEIPPPARHRHRPSDPLPLDPRRDPAPPMMPPRREAVTSLRGLAVTSVGGKSRSVSGNPR